MMTSVVSTIHLLAITSAVALAISSGESFDFRMLVMVPSMTGESSSQGVGVSNLTIDTRIYLLGDQCLSTAANQAAAAGVVVDPVSSLARVEDQCPVCCRLVVLDADEMPSQLLSLRARMDVFRVEGTEDPANDGHHHLLYCIASAVARAICSGESLALSMSVTRPQLTSDRAASGRLNKSL
ncbi:hypothetical protein DEA98_10060 [Brucella pseudogrignonensis]|nr:hypothetical protein [Brucella pseudogrignonensis]